MSEEGDNVLAFQMNQSALFHYGYESLRLINKTEEQKYTSSQSKSKNIDKKIGHI